MQRLKVLVTGRNGQVGSDLSAALHPHAHVLATDRASLDLSNPEQIRKVARNFQPQVIVNAAAYTAVDRAEDEADIAWTINAEAPSILADEAKALGAVFVHFSTDYVFDGEKPTAYFEDDVAAPLSAYGRSKLAGEQEVLRKGGKVLIFRTGWIYSARGNNFLLTILRLSREREVLKVVNDQTGAPTWSGRIADATLKVLQQVMQPGNASKPPGWGLFHMTAAGSTTWCGFARKILDSVRDLDPVTIDLVPISSAEFGAKAPRPRNSVLSNDKFLETFGFRLPSWENDFATVMQSLKKSSAIHEMQPVAAPSRKLT